MHTILHIILASSLIVQPFAKALDMDSISSALTQQEVNIPVQIRPLPDDFIEDDYLWDDLTDDLTEYYYLFDDLADDLTEDDFLLEDLYSSNVRLHYHYHFEDDVGPKIGCEEIKKEDNEEIDDDETVDCGVFLLSPPKEIPSEEPSTSSSLVPTGVPSNTMAPTMYPSAILTSSTPSQGEELKSDEPSFQTTSHAPSSFVSHEPTSLEKETNAYSVTHTKSLAIGTSYWVAGIAICVVAFVGGFVSSQFLSKKEGSTSSSTANNVHSSASSIQLSVEESVDSYHNHDCEDWSVSVVSWAPAAEPSIEVQTKLRTKANKGALANDEIEIEFQERDLEGYGNDYYEDEEDPRLFDVIDLSSQSSI